MRTAGIGLTLFAAACFVPSVVQRIRRQAGTTRGLFQLGRLASETARANRAAQFAEDCLAENRDLRADVAYWRGQYHGGVDAIIDRLRAAAGDDTPTHDRLLLEAMEREFEGGAS